MRKERLLEKKRETARDFPWYVRLSDDDLRAYSISQLRAMASILKTSEAYRLDCQTFYPLDVNRVVQTTTGRIVYIDEDEVCEITPEEVMQSAARSVYSAYLQRRKRTDD